MLSMNVVTANAASASGAAFPHAWPATGPLAAAGLAAGGSDVIDGSHVTLPTNPIGCAKHGLPAN